MRANSVGFAVALLLLAGAAPQAEPRGQTQAQSPGKVQAPAKRSSGPAPAGQNGSAEVPDGRFELTVDNIMRGSDLVGYPPTGLRWAGDSQQLYFDWRKPAEDKASTYAVSRSGGVPRKLSDDEVKNIPPATGGRWDKARRRVLFVDGGDVVMVDAISGIRRQITKTTGAESNPRWARNDTHVTWTREGNLFIAPIDGSGSALLTQLTDVAPRRPEPRLTDSQRFLRDEEEKLIDFVEKQKAEKKKTEDEQKKNRLPTFELQERQTAADLMLSPDDTHVFIVIAERAVGVKPTIVPNYITETGLYRGHSGAVQRRRHAGPPAARRAEPQDRQERPRRWQLRARAPGHRG